MPYPRKKERNREIVELRDKLGWSFNRIAKHVKRDRRTVRDIYYRERENYPEEYADIKPRNDLSTV